MKKTILPLFLLAFAIGISACQKCVECTNCPLGLSGDACMDEFDSKDDYNAAVANSRAAGCDCTEKLSAQ